MFTFLTAALVSAIAILGFGSSDPKFGLAGTFGLSAMFALAISLAAALGFYIAKRGFEHHSQRVIALAVVSGAVTQLLAYLPPVFGSAFWLILPLLVALTSGFATARLTELDTAILGWRSSSSNKSLERTREG